RGPLECRFPRGQFENGVTAVGHRVAWIRALGDGAVTGHQHRGYVLIDATAENVHARCLGLLNDRMRGLDHRLEVLLGNHHGLTGKRDQVLGHSRTPLLRRCQLLPIMAAASDRSPSSRTYSGPKPSSPSPDCG